MSGTSESRSGHPAASAGKQTGTFYCSGCGRKFRYTHDNQAVCLTHGCKFATKTPYRDDYDG